MSASDTRFVAGFRGRSGFVARAKTSVANRPRFVAFRRRWRAKRNKRGVRSPVLLVFFVLLLAAALRAQPALDHARRAQALLGSGVWSQILAIENTSRSSMYPRTVHALVFEFAGILWFYTDTDGTQSFSLHQNNLEEEKADFGPLLRDIEPGFVRWSIVTAAQPPVPDTGPGEVRNGCFIESVAELRRRLQTGAIMREPRLLSYYARVKNGQRGHTVLAYETDKYVEVFDPDRAEARLAFPKSLANDPLKLARAVQGRDIRTARYLTVPVADTATNALAAAPAAPATAGRPNSRSS